MRYQKSPQRMALISAFLVLGVLPGVIAAPPAESGNPTLYLDGIPVGLTQGGPGCATNTTFKNGSNSFQNSCYSINGTNPTTDSTRSSTIQIGNWFVGDASSSNGARVLINDTATGTDNMKLTGVTFTRATGTSTTTNTVSATSPCSNCSVGHVVLINKFDSAPTGIADYYWGKVVGGYYDPPGTENVINNRFRLFAKGCFTTTCTTSPTSSLFTVNLGSTLDTGTFSTSTALGLNGGVSRSSSAVKVQAGCNTGSNKCAPTLKYDYEIIVQGKDTLTITDSLSGCGGACRPPGVFNNLPACLDTTASNGSIVPGLQTLCDQRIANEAATDVAAILEEGGVISETCTGTCIILQLSGNPPASAASTTFDISGQGADVGNFSLTLDEQGTAGKVFSNLVPDSHPYAGDPNDRVFTIPVPPINISGGTWQSGSITCTSTLNNGTASWIIGGGPSDRSLTVLTIAEGDVLTCRWPVQ